MFLREVAHRFPLIARFPAGAARKWHAVCCIGGKKLPLLFRAPAIHLKLRKMRFKITPDFSISTALLQFHIEEVPGLSEAQLRRCARCGEFAPASGGELRPARATRVAQSLRGGRVAPPVPPCARTARAGVGQTRRSEFQPTDVQGREFALGLLLLAAQCEFQRVVALARRTFGGLCRLPRAGSPHASQPQCALLCGSRSHHGIPGEAVRRDRELNRVSRSLAALGRYR